MNATDLDTARARVLYAALALRVFTVPELAEHSGVKEHTVRTHLRRDRSWFESLGKVRSGGRGGSFIRYRLREEARAELRKASARISEYLAERGNRRVQADQALEDQEQFDVALAAAAESTELLRLAPTPAEAAKWLQRGRLQLVDAQRMSELVASQSNLQRLAEAQAAYAAAEASRVPAPSEVTLAPELSQPGFGRLLEMPPLDRKTIIGIRGALFDWSKQVGGVSMPLADETRIEELLDRVLTPVPKDDPQGTERERSVVPVAQFFVLFDKRQSSLCKALAPLLRTRILRSLDRGDIEPLARLAAIAALADVEEVVGVLFSATLDEIGNGGRTDPNVREILFGAIARFARPGGIKQWKSAAGFAQGVLSRTDSVAEFALLGPAALRAEMVDGPRLVRVLAERMFDSKSASSGRRLDSLQERAIMRNLALALHKRKYRPLLQEWSSLMSHDYGRAFIRALTNPAFGAVALRLENQAAFGLRLGSRLARRLRWRLPRSVDLPTERDSLDGRRLEELVDERPQFPVRPVFTGPLAQLRREYLNQFAQGAPPALGVHP